MLVTGVITVILKHTPLARPVCGASQVAAGSYVDLKDQMNQKTGAMYSSYKNPKKAHGQGSFGP